MSKPRRNGWLPYLKWGKAAWRGVILGQSEVFQRCVKIILHLEDKSKAQVDLICPERQNLESLAIALVFGLLT